MDLPEPERNGRRLVPLFALVNAPAVALLAWVAVTLCSEGSSGRAWTIAVVLTLLALAAGVAGGLMLYRAMADATGRLSGALAACADQRQQLQTVLETAADAILTFDDAGRVLTANGAAGRMFGHHPLELIGKPLHRLLPSSPRLGLTPLAEAVRRDGTRFPVAVAVSRVTVNTREMFTAIIHDLTEIHQAREAAEAASRAKTSFLVHMSHEVRTPLNGVLGAAELLAGSGLTGEQLDLLGTLRQSAEMLTAMLQQVLDFSRLEAGKVQLARQPFSLRQLVRDAIAPLEARARAKGVTLHHDSGEVPDVVVGDPARLREVLGHLLSNAVKFTASGKVTIRVEGGGGRVSGEDRGSSPATLHQPPSTILFEVSDTGIGIPAGKLQRIFEPFEQADDSATREYGGVGLGLAIASRLAELMGGALEVESAPGRGTTFRLHMPLGRATPSAPGDAAALVVLTDDARRAGVRASLGGCGWRSVGAATGRQALTELFEAVVQGTPFGLLVLEERLPDLTAAEVLGQLASRCGQACPTVLLCDDPAAVTVPAGVTALPHHSALARLRDVLPPLGQVPANQA